MLDWITNGDPKDLFARRCLKMLVVQQRFDEFHAAPTKSVGVDGAHRIRMAFDEKWVRESDRSALITAVAERRDREAFSTLFDCYAPRIKAFLIRRAAAPGVAEELAQEVMLTVWRKAEQFDPSRASASAWIFTIARNLRIDLARSDQRTRLLELASLDLLEVPASLDAGTLDAERVRKIDAALAELSDEQIRVVRLSFFEGYAHADIAKQLKLPLGTVKSRLRLAIKHLRERLAES